MIGGFLAKNMVDFRTKKRLRKILYSRPMIAALFVVFIFLAHAAWDMYKKESLAERKRAEAERELLALEERKAMLQEKIERLKTPEGVEEEIREKFGLAKKGEEVVVLVDEDKKKSENSDNSALDSVKRWWRSVREWLR